MMKILCIGNSFSEDSTKYLHELAEAGGIDVKVVNLFIGGCCLERHWNNAKDGRAGYERQKNGSASGPIVGIPETLDEDDWDLITLQQCSGLSGIMESYNPWAGLLSAFLKLHAPKARQAVHQTWAYETDSDHGQFALYHNSQDEMYAALTDCYRRLADSLSVPLIPFGKVIQTLRTLPPFDYQNGGISLCRDGFHMHEVYGRYALAATWYASVLKGNILENPFIPPTVRGVAPSREMIETVKKCVAGVIAERS